MITELVWERQNSCHNLSGRQVDKADRHTKCLRQYQLASVDIRIRHEGHWGVRYQLRKEKSISNIANYYFRWIAGTTSIVVALIETQPVNEEITDAALEKRSRYQVNLPTFPPAARCQNKPMHNVTSASPRRAIRKTR